MLHPMLARDGAGGDGDAACGVVVGLAVFVGCPVSNRSEGGTIGSSAKQIVD